MIKMMVTVVFVYTLCWLPYNLFMVSTALYKLVHVQHLHAVSTWKIKYVLEIPNAYLF